MDVGPHVNYMMGRQTGLVSAIVTVVLVVVLVCRSSSPPLDVCRVEDSVDSLTKACLNFLGSENLESLESLESLEHFEELVSELCA